MLYLPFTRRAVQPGRIVALPDGRVGTVASVGLSPYWLEAQAQIERAYVVSLPGQPSWADYALVEDLEVITGAAITAAETAAIA